MSLLGPYIVATATKSSDRRGKAAVATAGDNLHDLVLDPEAWPGSPADTFRDMAEFDLDQFLPYRVSVLAQQLSREFEGCYRRRFGIRVAEWRIMAHLWQSGPASVRDVGLRANLHKSRVSRAASRLEAAGHVTRTTNANDRRQIDLELTSSGQEMMTELIPIANCFQERLFTALGEDAKGFRQGVTRLLGEQQ